MLAALAHLVVCCAQAFGSWIQWCGPKGTPILWRTRCSDQLKTATTQLVWHQPCSIGAKVRTTAHSVWGVKSNAPEVIWRPRWGVLEAMARSCLAGFQITDGWNTYG